MTPAVAPAEITVRRVTPADQPALDELLSSLTPLDRYRRWFTAAPDVHADARRAARMGEGDVGLLAEHGDRAVGHAVLLPGPDGVGEVAFEVRPGWRRHGIASTLLAALVAAAREEGLRAVTAYVLQENADMLAVFHEHGGFAERTEGPVRQVTLTLGPTRAG